MSFIIYGALPCSYIYKGFWKYKGCKLTDKCWIILKTWTSIQCVPTLKYSHHLLVWSLLKCTHRNCCCSWAPPRRGPRGSWRCPASGWCQRDTGTCSGKRTRLRSGSLWTERQKMLIMDFKVLNMSFVLDQALPDPHWNRTRVVEFELPT